MTAATASHISALRPDPRNARKRTERSAGLIARSLEQFGAARSIVIDENGQILAGHGTIEAAAQVGIEDLLIVPANGRQIVAVQRTDLTPEQKTQYALADNRASDLSDWDADVLADLANDHDLSQWFRDDELAAIISPDSEEQEDTEGQGEGEGDGTLIECPACGHKWAPEEG